MEPSWIVDRLAIEEVLVRYCRAIDDRDWAFLDRVFTPEARIDYTSSGGVAGALPEVRAWLAEVLPRFEASQHLLGNLEIRVEGDRATSRAYFFNPMVRRLSDGSADVFYVGGTYVDRLLRTRDGWRIEERIEKQAWIDRRPAQPPSAAPPIREK